MGAAGCARRHHAEACARPRTAVRAEGPRRAGRLAEAVSQAAEPASADGTIGPRAGQCPRLRRAETRQADRASGVRRDWLHVSPLSGRDGWSSHGRRLRAIRRQPRADRIANRRTARR